ncbi:MAG: DNA polymerase III subunit [Oscillospiraceae bacterium]|nr:DNA polymerase III subunit [Oscillospiraceae bacterium]
MGLDGLLGNERLKAQMRAAIRSGRLSHGYLISGPDGSGKRTLAQLLAAAMECTGADAPCLSCAACRKVLSGNHPDVVTVDEPEKKQVSVERIRQARADAFIRPNEGKRKVFLIPRAQDLGTGAQNALLKILEEPPSYGAFLLLSDAPEALLPTVRSRCVELRMTPLEADVLRAELARRYPGRDRGDLDEIAAQSGGFLGRAVSLAEAEAAVLPQTAAFAAAYTGGDTLGLLELFCGMERLKRAQFAPVLEQMRRLLADALAVRQGGRTAAPEARAMAEKHTARALLDACEAVQGALDDCWGNVGIPNICAGLFVKLQK